MRRTRHWQRDLSPNLRSKSEPQWFPTGSFSLERDIYAILAQTSGDLYIVEGTRGDEFAILRFKRLLRPSNEVLTPLFTEHNHASQHVLHLILV